jgi:hypothetical protein
MIIKGKIFKAIKVASLNICVIERNELKQPLCNPNNKISSLTYGLCVVTRVTH